MLGYAVAVAVLHEGLHARCVVNTDDKTLVVADYCGGSEVYWVQRSQANRVFAKWSVNAPKSVSYLRIKARVTISSGGCAAALFFIIKVTREEMGTVGSNVIVVPVPGLAVGADVNMDTTSVGYLVFSCAEDVAEPPRDSPKPDSATVKIAKVHRELVLVPFFAKIRQGIGFSTPSKECRIVNWFDSANENVKSCIAANSADGAADEFVDDARHNPAATGCEQVADCSNTFPLLDEGVKPKPGKNELLVPSFVVLKFRDTMKKGEPAKLHLKGTTKRLVELFLQRVVPAATRALTGRVIREGFDNVGQMMLKTGKPDLLQCFRTCRNSDKITPERINSYMQMMQDLKAKFRAEGFLYESDYEEFDVSKDVSPNGRVVERDHPISNEVCQRIKWMNHTTQMKRDQTFSWQASARKVKRRRACR